MTYSEWKAKVAKKERSIKQSIPIMPESTYRYRDNRLKECGLLEWERFWLVAHTINTPRTKAMLRERKRIYQSALYTEMSRSEYREMISDKYNKYGWTFNNGDLNPFAMLEFYCDREDPKNKWPYSKNTPKVKKNFVKAKAITKAKKDKQIYTDAYRKTHPWQKRLEKQMLN